MGLSERQKISRKEAKKVLKQYEEAMPGIHNLMQYFTSFCRRNGYTETPFYGRRRYFPNILDSDSKLRGEAERECGNMPVQGGASEIVKLAQIQILAEMRRQKMLTRMVMQVHDEVLFESPPEEMEEIRYLISEIAPNVVPMHVPLVVKPMTGLSWAEVH